MKMESWRTETSFIFIMSVNIKKILLENIKIYFIYIFGS